MSEGGKHHMEGIHRGGRDRGVHQWLRSCHFRELGVHGCGTLEKKASQSSIVTHRRSMEEHTQSLLLRKSPEVCMDLDSD